MQEYLLPGMARMTKMRPLLRPNRHYRTLKAPTTHSQALHRCSHKNNATNPSLRQQFLIPLREAHTLVYNIPKREHQKQFRKATETNTKLQIIKQEWYKTTSDYINSLLQTFNTKPFTTETKPRPPLVLSRRSHRKAACLSCDHRLSSVIAFT